MERRPQGIKARFTGSHTGGAALSVYVLCACGSACALPRSGRHDDEASRWLLIEIACWFFVGFFFPRAAPILSEVKLQRLCRET